MDRIDVKTTENQLRQEFIQGYGYPPKIAEALVNTVIEPFKHQKEYQIKINFAKMLRMMSKIFNVREVCYTACHDVNNLFIFISLITSF